MAVVGPTHPAKGGVAAHTTELARQLSRAGHECDLVSWSRLYPALLYPGVQGVPHGAPDIAPYARTTRPLSWARPDSWWRVGRSLRGYDLVVVVHIVPVVVPAHLVLLRALRGGAGPRPRVVLIAHNVLPHEPHVGAGALMRALLAQVDGVVVHSAEQADVAHAHGAGAVSVLDLPPHLPGGPPVPRPDHDGPPRLLALGVVRDYKGIDLLVEAVQQVPDLTLTVAGELWGQAGQRVRDLAADTRSGGRVDVREGYVPGPAIAPLLAAHDVLALPYRSATASQNALLGLTHGMPVLATRVGSFAQDVRDGVDGLLAEPASLGSLVEVLRRLTEPGRLNELRDGVRPPDLQARWAPYVDGLLDAGCRG